MLMPMENCAKTLAGSRMSNPARNDLHTVRIPELFISKPPVSHIHADSDAFVGRNAAPALFSHS